MEVKSDLSLEEATDRWVTGVIIDNFDILLEWTENALPPPTERIADAPSIIEISSRYCC